MSSLRINPCGSGLGGEEWASVLAPWLTAKYLPDILKEATGKSIKEQRKLVRAQTVLVQAAGREAQAEFERQVEWRRLRDLITSQINSNLTAIRFKAGIFNRDYDGLVAVASKQGAPVDEIAPLRESVVQVLAQLPRIDVSTDDMNLLEQFKVDTDTFRWVVDEAYTRLLAFGRKLKVQVDEQQARADDAAHRAMLAEIRDREEQIKRERQGVLVAIKKQEELYKRLVELRDEVERQREELKKELELASAGERELQAISAVRGKGRV